MDSSDNVLAGINHSLQDGWQAKLKPNGRLFYLDHNSKSSGWLPPPTCWSPKADLPYGWEEAVDKNGKRYYINHVTCTTTREDPYDVDDIPPVERDVTLLRDLALGFGFIAGSEKPVVVRSVTEGGPSVGKLLPGDMIIRLNGEDVKMKDGPYIIERIRQSSETIRLTVIQPYIDKTGLKSSFLSANKKQKLKSKPSKVRFADNVKAAAVAPGKSPPSLVYLPSVLKVYLENGQTKSFKYDNKTSVKEVLKNLKEKLDLKSIEHFSLVVQTMDDSTKPNKFTILQEDETLTQIASRPGSQDWKCLLRVTFVPQDAYDLLSKDSKAFDYFYLQCCNDVINEWFVDELDSDRAIRLAALQIQQHFLNSKQSTKVSLKALEKEEGLDRFLPPSICKKMKSKELKRLIGQHVKQSQCLSAPGQKHLTELQAKLHYLKIICDLRSFGGRFFTGTMVTNVESENLLDYHCTVLVGPKCGITQIISMVHNVTSLLAEFSQLTDIQLCPALVDGDCLRVELHVKNQKPIVMLLTHDDAYDMVTLVNGYYRLFVDGNRSLLPSHYSHSAETEAPPYADKHRVILADWNYPNGLVSELVSGEGEAEGRGEWGGHRGGGEGEYTVDLSMGPPPYEADIAYINRLKALGRFHPLEAAGGQPDGAVMSYTIQEESEEYEPSDSYNNTLQKNSNNSLNSSTISKSASDSSTISSWSDKSLDLTKLSDMVEDMFEDVRTPKSETGEDGLAPMQENRLDMMIDGSEEKKVYLETSGDTYNMPRRKSLTKHFDVSDSVAMYSPINERKSKGQVKLLHYTIYNDNSLIPVGEICPSLSDCEDYAGEEEEEEEEEDETELQEMIPVSNENSSRGKLVVQDSVLLAHTRHASKEDGLRDASNDNQDENDRDIKTDAFHNSSRSNSSVDSDIVDLTQTSFVSSPGKDDSLTESEIPPLNLSNLCTKKTDEEQVDKLPASDSPVPVSIIDLPSPDVEEELSDEAHGFQLSTLDAINVSLHHKDNLLSRSVQRDPECESDSGNETISSEIIDNGVADESFLSHSPSDYFSMVCGRKSPSRAENVDRDPTPTPELSGDNPPNLVSSLGSDTDSISTLHGSSPNLSAFEGSASDTLESDSKSQEDTIDELIASLIISPPTVEMGDLDEELLNAVIPPPPMSDFDIGVIESLIVPPPPAITPPISPPKTPTKSLKTKSPSSSDSSFTTTVMINLIEGPVLSKEITSLEIELPKGQLNTYSASPKEDFHTTLFSKDSPIHLEKDSTIRASLKESPIRSEKDSPIRFIDESSTQALLKDSPIRSQEKSPIQALLKDSPIRSKKDSTIRSQEESPIQAFQKDSPIRSEEKSPIQALHKDSQIRSHEESPIQALLQDSPIRSQEKSPIQTLLKDSSIRSQKESPIQAFQKDSAIRSHEKSPITPHNAPEPESSTIQSNSRPNSPIKVPVSPSKGEPNPSNASSSRPRKISSSMLSSSQDSGFSQLGPGDLDHIGVALDEINTGQSKFKEAKRVEVRNRENHLNEDTTFTEHSEDCETPSAEIGGSSEIDSDGGDDCGSVESSKDIPDSVLAALLTAVEPIPEVKSIKVAPKVPPKRVVRPKVARQASVDSLTGGDFDTTVPPKKSEPKETSPSAPEPPPRRRYSPGLFKKIYQFETGKAVEVQERSSSVHRSSSLKVVSKAVSSDQMNGKCAVQTEETVKTVKRSSSFAPGQRSGLINVGTEDEEAYQDSRRGEDVNLGPSEIIDNKTKSNTNNKTILGPRLSVDSELGLENESHQPIARSNTFSAGVAPDGKKPRRKAPPPPPPKPDHLKRSKEKQNFRNTVSSSSPSSIAKLLSPSRSLSFLRGAKPFSKSSSKSDEPALPTSPKEKRRSRPLRAFRSLSRKDSYDVSMFDHKKDKSGEPSFKESQKLRTVGGLHRRVSQDLSDVFDEPQTNPRPVSLYDARSKSEDLSSASDLSFAPLRHSQSLSKATSRPVSYPSSPQKYPGPGSIHASLPKRPPPPRPNNPPASPRKAMYPSDDSLSSSSSEMQLSPVPLPSPSGYDQDSTDSDDFSTPPPLPVSLPPVKSRPRALPEHFIPPPSFTSTKSMNSFESDVSADSYTLELESKEYLGKESVAEALGDIRLLISELQTCILAEESEPSLRQFKFCKDSLVSEVREFTSNTKMLVSSAGQSEAQLVRSVNSSMHTLARLCSDTQQMMKAMVSIMQATNLGNKTKEIASNFSNTLSAASEAHGKNLNDPKMQLLLRQAQTMAAMLSALMRTLRMLQS
ncbi:uncharacterized protein [Asterias amurensis]|uniref:uncharacterized protein n=1 Tax=Asterias amurensis TaxID=7602 RepID=UPI003AB3D730